VRFGLAETDLNTPFLPESTLANLAVAFPPASRVFRKHGLGRAAGPKRPAAAVRSLRETP